MEYVICTAQNAWSDTEGQIMIDKYREYQHEVGPMKKFKNKKSMWEKISADILAELGSLKTAAQCENRYKTIRKRKGWSDDFLSDKATNNIEITISSDEVSPKRRKSNDNQNHSVYQPNTTESDDSLLKPQESEPTVEVDVRRGVGQVSYSHTTCESNEEEEKREKRRFRQTLSSVLLQIHREKEEAKERRHQEKMELLRSLLQ